MRRNQRGLTFEAPSAPMRTPNLVAEVVIQQTHEAMNLLLEARAYSQSLQRNVWDFAVESHRLSGLSCNHLRWLLCQGFVEHAAEVTSVVNDARTFRRLGPLELTKNTCFILTDTGVLYARPLLTESKVLLSGACLTPSDHIGADIPHWDRDARQLRLGTCVVKQFRVPASNQELVLAAFEVGHWPIRLDDPFSPIPGQDSKRRLHETIDRLNRNQIQRLICFRGDGTGQGVRWEPFIAADQSPIDRPPLVKQALQVDHGLVVPGELGVPEPFMVHLLKAYEAANQLQRDPWEFAVEIATLRELGATNLALRCLVCREFGQQADEVISRFRSQKRTFRTIPLLGFSEKTCFVLTSQGAQSVAKSVEASFRNRDWLHLEGQQPHRRRQPRWARKDHKLWAEGLLVKQFKQSAPSQEAILNALHELHWKQGIDDPLTGNGVDPKERLQNTLKNLSRYQENQLLRFFGDATGQHVFWKWL
jgi:hypothetical protein